MSTISAEDVKLAALQTSQPLVLRGFVLEWSLLSRPLDAWSEEFGDRKVPWRVGARARVSDEPCWERTCERRDLTFRQFLDATKSGDKWMYFDYKHLPEWFSSNSDLSKNVSWAKFGFPEKGAAESTLWVGSAGAHTPTHRDTYGCNVVAQLHGKKRWILFPPETGGLRPTRVPYEESSVYSELNFCCPYDLEPFKSLSGCRCVELEAGDALLVPHGWWHHVLNTSPVAITLNTWLPHEADASARVSEALVRVLVAQLCQDLPRDTAALLLNPNDETDASARVSEALVRVLVAQLCKDLPRDTAALLLNPNEDDLPETPLAVLFLQLDAVAGELRDQRRRLRRLKRQKTSEGEPPPPPPPSADTAPPIADPAPPSADPTPPTAAPAPPAAAPLPPLTGEQLAELLRGEAARLAGGAAAAEDDADGGTSKLRLTRALINAYSQSDVVELVKQNLLNSLS